MTRRQLVNVDDPVTLGELAAARKKCGEAASLLNEGQRGGRIAILPFRHDALFLEQSAIWVQNGGFRWVCVRWGISHRQTCKNRWLGVNGDDVPTVAVCSYTHAPDRLLAILGKRSDSASYVPQHFESLRKPAPNINSGKRMLAIGPLVLAMLPRYSHGLLLGAQ